MAGTARGEDLGETAGFGRGVSSASGEFMLEVSERREGFGRMMNGAKQGFGRWIRRVTAEEGLQRSDLG